MQYLLLVILFCLYIDVIQQLCNTSTQDIYQVTQETYTAYLYCRIKCISTTCCDILSADPHDNLSFSYYSCLQVLRIQDKPTHFSLFKHIVNINTFDKHPSVLHSRKLKEVRVYSCQISTDGYQNNYVLELCTACTSINTIVTYFDTGSNTHSLLYLRQNKGFLVKRRGNAYRAWEVAPRVSMKNEPRPRQGHAGEEAGCGGGGGAGPICLTKYYES